MAIEVGIFRRGYPFLLDVPVDIRLSEIHDAEAIPTTQPIEDGSPLTDHIILTPDTVTILAEIGNYDEITIGGISTGLSTLGLTSGERAKAAWFRFKQQLRLRELYTVVTAHEIYTDMCLARLNGVNEAPFQGRMVYALTFIKLDLTQTSLIMLPEEQFSEDIRKNASSQVNGGQQDPMNNNSSLAVQIGQAAGVLE